MTSTLQDPVLLSETTATMLHPNPRLRLAGRMIVMKDIVERKYSNGAVVYACKREEGCDYTADIPQRVFGHLGKHSPSRRENIAKGMARRTKANAEPLTREALHKALDDYLDATSGSSQVAQVTERMEAWKERAVVAERKLREVEKAQRTLSIVFGNAQPKVAAEAS